MITLGFPHGSNSKESAYNAEDLSSIPRSGRFAGEGNGHPLQYSWLENSIDGGVWWAWVHEVKESDMTEWITHTHDYFNVIFSNQTNENILNSTITGAFKLWHTYIMEYYAVIKMFRKRFLWSGEYLWHSIKWAMHKGLSQLHKYMYGEKKYTKY